MVKKDECNIYCLFSRNLENVGLVKDTVQSLPQLAPTTLGIRIGTTSNVLIGIRLLFLEIVPVKYQIMRMSQTMSLKFTYLIF